MNARSGVLALATVRGERRQVAECGSCERVRPLIERGLCDSCRSLRRKDGTIGDYGYVKTDRMQDYAELRQFGESVAVAASRVGVSERTGWRYEAQLREADRNVTAFAVEAAGWLTPRRAA